MPVTVFLKLVCEYPESQASKGLQRYIEPGAKNMFINYEI